VSEPQAVPALNRPAPAGLFENVALKPLASARYLPVANPSGIPLADRKSLPALPGSEKEVQSTSRLAPPGSAAAFVTQG